MHKNEHNRQKIWEMLKCIMDKFSSIIDTGLHMYIKSKEISQYSYVAIHKLIRVIKKLIPTFGLISS